MQEELVKEITQLVMEELGKQKAPMQISAEDTMTDEHAPSPKSSALVSLYGRNRKKRIIAKEEKIEEMIPLYHKSPSAKNNDSEGEPIVLKVPEDPGDDRLQQEEGSYLKYTPARVAVGRAGSRPRTSTLLRFRFDHASAVDAVYGDVSQELLDKLQLFTVETKVEEKEVYIRRPDLGRRLSNDSKDMIKQRCTPSPTVQIIASNGLSASAVNANLEDVYLSLKQSLENMNIQMGTPFYAHQGRVGLMDDIGEVLEPEVVVNLIGERPGLVSAESLSAYLCYKPRHGTIESDRMVISNIHQGGIPPVEAGAYIGTVVERMLKHKASGVKLIQKEG